METSEDRTTKKRTQTRYRKKNESGNTKSKRRKSVQKFSRSSRDLRHKTTTFERKAVKGEEAAAAAEEEAVAVNAADQKATPPPNATRKSMTTRPPSRWTNSEQKSSPKNFSASRSPRLSAGTSNENETTNRLRAAAFRAIRERLLLLLRERSPHSSSPSKLELKTQKKSKSEREREKER
jgi:hypothetical protein